MKKQTQADARDQRDESQAPPSKKPRIDIERKKCPKCQTPFRTNKKSNFSSKIVS